MMIGHKIDQQHLRNDRLRQENSLLDGKIYAIRSLKAEKENLVVRINIIKELQANRPLAVYLFDEIVQMIPRGIYLTSITRKANRLLLAGVAESHSQVSTLMLRADSSPWLSHSMLDQIKKREGKNNPEGNSFQVSVTINPPQKTMAKEEVEP